MEFKSGQQRIRFIAIRDRKITVQRRFIAVTETKLFLQRHRIKLSRDVGKELKIWVCYFCSSLMGISELGCTFVVLK